MTMNFTPGTYDADRKCYMFTEEVRTVNVSNDNGAEIIRALGFVCDDGGMDAVPIDTFITRCQSFLRNHLGKPDPGKPTVISRSDVGALMERLVSDHSLMLGKMQGLMVETFQPTIEVTRPGSGPTIVECGRPEGYLMDRIRKILGTIQEAKELGATMVWAG